MPEVDWNVNFWKNYNWTSGGEEWSDAWGGSEAQWFGSIYPRLHRFLPAPAILEIATGFGRWTPFLLSACDEYVGVDLTEKCVAHCREIFHQVPHAQFIQNDGLSLAAAPDARYDLVFSFDSLVHVEADVMDSYVPQIIRKLSPNGLAFVHHSNLASLAPEFRNEGFRGRSVSAETVAVAIEQAGGKVLVQERINWLSAHLVDCLTLFARTDRPGSSAAAHIRNMRFGDEASIIRDTHAPYNRI